jgi:hypothetical protein
MKLLLSEISRLLPKRDWLALLAALAWLLLLVAPYVRA